MLISREKEQRIKTEAFQANEKVYLCLKVIVCLLAVALVWVCLNPGLSPAKARGT